MKTDKISFENTYGSESFFQKGQETKNKLVYTLIPVKTEYIKPNESYDIIIKHAANLLIDGDFLVISETPISVSQGRLFDESKFKSSFFSFLLADVWSKYMWGYFFGPMFRIKSRTIKNLRKLPPEARVHKKVILEHYGLKHALKPASEAGVDLSNVPGTMVSLLPENPNDVAKDFAKKIWDDFKKDVTVMIIDTDASYQLIGKRFTSLPIAVQGIKSDLGIFGYLLGRFGKIIGPTPLGVSRPVKLDTMLKIAKLAEEYHENNEKNIKTVYDMENIFERDITGITIEMLNSIEHTPAIIVRRRF